MKIKITLNSGRKILFENEDYDSIGDFIKGEFENIQGKVDWCFIDKNTCIQVCNIDSIEEV